ncbi:multiheme c-type cytochrome [Alloacidobacterium sp.]|uniref:multiheme c-type cytochrome n=1 Tax=Alloacidobacterium sp. TaxID=2951999 RepID=UPI002D46CAF8|nr:multiheme c-type cytochrome [Alloacidobacterium sp.]HYK34930.1 multiheme c-type cytochrome [Alloacidobacterium sp.]
MSFRSVFVAVVIAFALIVSAFLINRQRPSVETTQPTADFVKASGKCAECHARMQYAVVHEYEMSAHAKKGVNCLDCHQPSEGQQKQDHHGFVIAAHLTAGNCRSCHEGIYQEFLRSRHAATSWAAIYGEKGLKPEQVAFAEQYQPGGTKRPPHPFVTAEGTSAMVSGCEQCHAIGKPNDDGTIGTCTACHSRHTSSIALARLPSTCAQCHMGPDHSQIEIYEESKHGVMFAAQEHLLNLNAEPKSLTTRDMFVPTCATCHMSGLNGLKVTHDPTERLSFYLADAVTQKRPNYARAQANMKEVCAQCHTQDVIDRVYTQAEAVVASTNAKVQHAQAIVNGLRSDGLLSGPPFSNPVDFLYFDLWHYDGRTSKHGAFMGGADFVQWHGNYPMMQKTVELEQLAAELRRERAHK